VASRLPGDSNSTRTGYADLIGVSPAIGFLAKSALSGDAVRSLLGEPG